MKAFEYSVYNREVDTEELDWMGKNGWELISYIVIPKFSTGYGESSFYHKIVFKREIEKK